MPSPRRSPGPLLQETREHWPLMNLYERFEHVVAFILSLIIAVVIALAMIQLLARVVPVLLSGGAAQSIPSTTRFSKVCSGIS